MSRFFINSKSIAVAASVLTVGLFGAGLAGAQPAQPAKKNTRTEIVFWGVSLGSDSKGQDAVIREFERRNPDLSVRVLSMGAGKMDPQKLMTSIVGNVAPDVINQDRFTISDWASRGAFRSLNDLVERDKNDPEAPKKEQYYDSCWEEAMYDGNLYAVPTGADNRILYWNRARFKEKAAELEKAGLDPNRPPRTWSEILAYSKVLTEFDKSGRLVKAGFMPNFGNSWLYMYGFMNNASFLSEDGRKCTMATPEAAEALQFMVDGYKIVGGYEKAKSFESGFRGGENDAFIVGQVAMKIDGDWILNTMSRYAPALDFGVAPPPVPDDRFYKRGRFTNEKDTFVTWVGGSSLAIPRGARYPEAAWRFIKFATSTEGRMVESRAQNEWEKLKGRAFMARQMASKEFNELQAKEFRPAAKNFADAIDMHVEMANYGRIRPVTFVGQVMWQEHVRAMEAACYGKNSPMGALKEAQSNVQRELDAYFEKERYPVIDLRLPAVLGVLALVGVVILMIVSFYRAKLGRLERGEAKWAYLFISPWILGFLIFTIGPMVASLFFSFTQYDVLNEARFVGFKNYAEMFGSDKTRLLKALSNAAYLAGVGVPLGLSTGLAVAMLLNMAARGMRFYRTVFYMPAIVPGIASAVLWSWVLTPDPGKGLINSYWVKSISAWMGLEVPGWLTSADWAKPALIVMGVWGAGSGMILWLAGLKGVSTTLYEAAGIDGATPGRQFWSITFPQLSPIIFFNTVMGFIGSMQEFDRIYVMKPNGDGPIGPDDSMLTPVYHLFNNGFAYFKMGYASALAWLIFTIILVITAVQFQLRSRWVYYESDK